MNVLVKPSHISFGHLVDYPKENFDKLLFYVSTVVVTVVLLTVIQLITEASTHQKREREREYAVCVCVCVCVCVYMHAMYTCGDAIAMYSKPATTEHIEHAASRYVCTCMHDKWFMWKERTLMWGGQGG